MTASIEEVMTAGIAEMMTAGIWEVMTVGDLMQRRLVHVIRPYLSRVACCSLVSSLGLGSQIRVDRQAHLPSWLHTCTPPCGCTAHTACGEQQRYGRGVRGYQGVLGTCGPVGHVARVHSTPECSTSCCCTPYMNDATPTLPA